MALGGKRAGSGRKKGSKSLEKEKVMKELRERIMKNANSLFNAAKSSAVGNQYLYKIETKYEGKRRIRSKPILVTNKQEIEDYIDSLGEEIEDRDEDDNVYYFISTKEPNVQAIRDLMDRAFGRATEHIELAGKVNVKFDE